MVHKIKFKTVALKVFEIPNTSSKSKSPSTRYSTYICHVKGPTALLIPKCLKEFLLERETAPGIKRTITLSP
jgi:hypothetical protein